MGIKPQNIPQTSNSLLSLTKSMVATSEDVIQSEPYTSPRTSVNPSTHVCAPLHAPPHTSVQDSDR